MIPDSVLSLLLTFVTGLIVGIIVEHYTFKHNLQIERIKTISPIILEVYPIIEQIVEDTNYALGVRQRNDEDKFTSLIETLFHDLGKYKMWDEKYRETGFKLNLRHVSKGLNESLDDMCIYAINTKLQGKNYIFGILEEMHKTSKKCRDEITKSNIV